MPLVSVIGDKSSAGAGSIKEDAGCDTVFAEGKAIVQGIPSNKTNAFPDGACDDGNKHCNQTGPVKGSGSVFIEGKAIHRVGDERGCGHTTVASISTVYAN